MGLVAVTLEGGLSFVLLNLIAYTKSDTNITSSSNLIQNILSYLQMCEFGW